LSKKKINKLFLGWISRKNPSYTSNPFIIFLSKSFIDLQYLWCHLQKPREFAVIKSFPLKSNQIPINWTGNRLRDLNLGEKKTYKSFSIVSPQIPFTHLRNPKSLFLFHSPLSLLSHFLFLSPETDLAIITEPSSTVKTSA
jgi:hypothetical protein